VFCPTCATPIDSQKFCPKCGSPAPVIPVLPGTAPAPTERPATVRTAGNLLFAAIALNLLGTLYAWTYVARSRFPVGSFVPSALILALWVFLILQMQQGKNWARFGVVLGIAWSAFVVLTTLRFLRYGAQFGAMGFSWVSFGMRLWAGYLLFRPESNAWFK